MGAGGAIHVEQGTVNCSATAPGNLGFFVNTAAEGGGVWAGTSVVSHDCDWGQMADDNSPNDLDIPLEPEPWLKGSPEARQVPWNFDRDLLRPAGLLTRYS